MKIKVKLRVAELPALEETLELDDRKLEGLTEEEVENAVEIVISTWANSRISIEWEADDPPEDYEKNL